MGTEGEGIRQYPGELKKRPLGKDEGDLLKTLILVFSNCLNGILSHCFNILFKAMEMKIDSV